MVIELLTGDNLGVVVIISHVLSHSTESSVLRGAVSLLSGHSGKVSRFSDDFTIFVSEILLNVVIGLHMLVSELKRLLDFSSRLERSIVLGGLSQGLGIAHLHLSSINVGLTYKFKQQKDTQVKYRNVYFPTLQTRLNNEIVESFKPNDYYLKLIGKFRRFVFLTSLEYVSGGTE